MKITKSTFQDIDEIFRLYEIATTLQKDLGLVHWPVFEREMVEDEIADDRQWKLVIENQIACVWAIAYSDEQIWEHRSNETSIYIHRIATNPNFKGRQLVSNIVDWAKAFAKEHNKKFIRLDTVGENHGLIKHYKKCGFNYLGLFKLKNTEGLPAHYDNASVALFEIRLD